LFISLCLRGLLPRAVRIGRAAATALVLLLAGILAVPSDAGAQQRPSAGPRSAAVTPATPTPEKPAPPPLSEEQALKGALDVRLAYILTGDKEIDDLSRA